MLELCPATLLWYVEVSESVIPPSNTASGTFAGLLRDRRRLTAIGNAEALVATSMTPASKSSTHWSYHVVTFFFWLHREDPRRIYTYQTRCFEDVMILRLQHQQPEAVKSRQSPVFTNTPPEWRVL